MLLRVAAAADRAWEPVVVKPYIPQLNPVGDVCIGWLTGRTDGFATAYAPASGDADSAKD